VDTDYSDMDAIARKSERIVLRQLAKVGQLAVADAMGVSESTVSRMKDRDEKGGPSQIQKWCKALAAMGLKITPAEYRCYDPKQIEAVFVLAQKYVSSMQSSAELLFEDDE
jgi:transcriptional regulator with XRE-family HTH domain